MTELEMTRLQNVQDRAGRLWAQLRALKALALEMRDRPSKDRNDWGNDVTAVADLVVLIEPEAAGLACDLSVFEIRESEFEEVAK